MTEDMVIVGRKMLFDVFLMYQLLIALPELTVGWLSDTEVLL
jgi:hypothetical protein